MPDFPDSSPHLDLPFILPSQAQKHVTYNEAMRRLDAMSHLSVASRSAATPPASPETGARYILPEGATGAWSGNDEGVLTWFDGGAWQFEVPRTGWTAWIEDEDAQRVYDGSSWIQAGDHQNLPLVGVQTTADTTNRLAVASEATLLTHAGGGHQLKLNKAAATETASLLFQTGWEGRAEMGTTGSDAFEIKVSADGAAFETALRADPQSGRVSFPASAVRWDGPYCTGDRQSRITVSATWGLVNPSQIQRLIDGAMGQHVYSNGNDQAGKHIAFALDTPQEIVEFRCHFSNSTTGTVKTVIQAADDPAGPWLTISAPTAWADAMANGIVTLPCHPPQGFAHYRIAAVSGVASTSPWFHGVEMTTRG